MANRAESVLGALREFLKGKGWQYLEDENGMVRGLFSGDNGQWHWVAHGSGDDRFVVFSAYCPLNVPMRRRAAAAEYLMRANWGLAFGNFEMDWCDGQVSFRTSLPAIVPIVQEAIDHLVCANCSLMDRYLPGLISVAFGKVTPQKAVAEAERGIAVTPLDGEAAQPQSLPSDENARNQRSGQWPEQFSPGNN